jgi:hypothetical protein
VTLARLLQRLSDRVARTDGGVRLPDGRVVSSDAAPRALEDWLYERVFIAWRPPAGRFADSLGGAPHFTAALLDAVGEATWLAPGFELLSRSPAGAFVVNDGVRLFVPARADVRPAHARPGEAVRVRLPCAREHALPGFFCFHARLGRLDDARPHLKLYLNVKPSFAPTLLRWLFADRALERVRFDGKVVNDPDAFGRRDTALLYVEPKGTPAVLRSLARLRRSHGGGFRDGVPPFVLPLAPGLGVAESPAGGHESFGAQRCRLTAAGLLDRLDAPGLTAFAAVERRFAAHGLDLGQPWLGLLPPAWVATARRAHHPRAG